MDSLWKDFHYATRRLFQAPLFSALAVVILALGIGANVAIFSIANTFLFQPLPFSEPQRLVDIYQDSDDGEPASNSFPAYRDIASHTQLFSSVAASYIFSASLQTEDRAQPVLIEYATASYLPTLGLEPTVGRWFEPAEDGLGAGAATVVSYHSWRARHGSDPDILGKTIQLNGSSVTVVGVGPESYSGGPAIVVDYWLSISSLGVTAPPWAAGTLERRQDHWFLVRARLEAGVSPEAAQDGMTALATRLAREFPELNEGRDITVFANQDVRLHPSIDGMLYPVAATLMAIVGLVLLVACSNLANILLAKSSARVKEVAIRLAMGASRRRVAAQLLTESVLLSLTGGFVGYVLASWLLRVVMAMDLLLPLSVPISLQIGPDYRVMLFAAALALVTGILFGLAPALKATRPDLVSSLRDEGSITALGRRRFGLRNVLVVVQVAVSVVLLFGAGLLVRSFLNAQRTDVGFAVDGVAMMTTDTSHPGYESEQSRALYRELEERVQALAGVTHAAITAPPPLTPFGGSSTLVIDGYADANGTDAVEVRWQSVSPNYFQTLSIPILHGRSFNETDREDGRRVAIVNETMARMYWAESDVVGKRFRFQSSEDSWVEIIGVAARTKVRTVGESQIALFYRPISQGAGMRYTVVARGSLPASAMVAPMRRTLRELDTNLPVLDSGTMSEHIGEALMGARLGAWMMAAAGVLALLLAALGLYGVVAFIVSQRTLEVGVRVALGARSSQVVSMIVKEMMFVVGIGIASGIVLALLGAPVLASLLHGVEPTDLSTTFIVGVVLLAVTVLASWLPARRAARMDPVTALHYS